MKNWILHREKRQHVVVQRVKRRFQRGYQLGNVLCGLLMTALHQSTPNIIWVGKIIRFQSSQLSWGKMISVLLKCNRVSFSPFFLIALFPAALTLNIKFSTFTNSCRTARYEYQYITTYRLTMGSWNLSCHCDYSKNKWNCLLPCN